jgi:hypothetical protein
MTGFINTLYIHTTRDYRQYSDIAYLHTFQFTAAHALGFSIITSRILRGVFSSQSDPFLAIILQLPIPKTGLTSIPLLLTGWPPEVRLFTLCHYCSICGRVFCVLLLHLGTDPTENTAYVVNEACLPRRCLATDVLLSRVLAFVEMCLPSRCLAMGIHATISIILK